MHPFNILSVMFVCFKASGIEKIRYMQISFSLSSSSYYMHVSMGREYYYFRLNAIRVHKG